MTGPHFRITAVTFDDQENVSTVTAIASGDCVDVILTVIPRVEITEGSPAKVTMPLTDLLELHRAAGSVSDDDDPRFEGSRLICNSLRKIVDGLVQK